MAMTLTETKQLTNPLEGQDPELHVFLALQGGGALGAFEAGVIEYLHENLEIGSSIKAVSGVSFGAINAAVYAANIHDDPVGALKELWNKLTFIDSPLFLKVNPLRGTAFENLVPDLSPPALALFPFLNPNFYKARMDYWNVGSWTYLLDNARLLPVLNELIDFEKLNSTDNPQLILTSADIQSGELAVFDNRQGTLRVEHILASASLPPMFSPTVIDNTFYWDGGIFDNSPFETLVQSLTAENIWQHPNDLVPGTNQVLPPRDPTYKRLITVELSPRQGNLPNNFFDTINRVLQIILRVKFSDAARDNLFEFGVLMNWLERFFTLLANVDAPKSDFSGGNVPSNAIVEFQTFIAGLGLDPKNFAAGVAGAARRALSLYFQEDRPGDWKGKGFPVSERATIPRIDELVNKGISLRALATIQQFAQLSNESADTNLRSLFESLRTSRLVVDQVTRYTNFELFPIKANFSSDLLSIGDFSSSKIKKLYDTGLLAAQEQIIIAEYDGTNSKGEQVPKKDLQFIPNPNA